jgi:hypothetical protein
MGFLCTDLQNINLKDHQPALDMDSSGSFADILQPRKPVIRAPMNIRVPNHGAAADHVNPKDLIEPS